MTLALYVALGMVGGLFMQVLLSWLRARRARRAWRAYLNARAAFGRASTKGFPDDQSHSEDEPRQA